MREKEWGWKEREEWGGAPARLPLITATSKLKYRVLGSTKKTIKNFFDENYFYSLLKE